MRYWSRSERSSKVSRVIRGEGVGTVDEAMVVGGVIEVGDKVGAEVVVAGEGAGASSSPSAGGSIHSFAK